MLLFGCQAFMKIVQAVSSRPVTLFHLLQDGTFEEWRDFLLLYLK
jgi:hypothetical protein